MCYSYSYDSNKLQVSKILIPSVLRVAWQDLGHLELLG